MIRGVRLCISTDWRGQPLVSLAVIVNLIGATRTTAGRRVRCEPRPRSHPNEQDIPDDQMAMLNRIQHGFSEDWSYTLHPARKRH